MAHDPRHWQIAVLTGLLLYGLGWLAFDVTPTQIVFTIGTALAVQVAGDTLTGRPRTSGAKSALISSLSLCLLLRTSVPAVAALGAALAVGSKFLLRVHQRHVFNPTNFALVLLMASTTAVWVSPAQWGSQALFAALMACLGGMVVSRAVRADVTLTFLAVYVGLLVARSVALGEPLSIPLHRLQNGSLLLFAFFMISDPKTTPASRPGRVLFATAVALGAAYVQFGLYRQNGLLWSLVACAPFVPLIDRYLPGVPYQWHQQRSQHSLARATSPPTLSRGIATRLAHLTHTFTKGSIMQRRRISLGCLVALALGLTTEPLAAFCGFYVAKADTTLYNQASQVVLVRDGDREVITMVNDFRGPVTEFAMVVPVPTFIERGQIHVADNALVEHLDAFTAPRLVEYFDGDPCEMYRLQERAADRAEAALPASAPTRQSAVGRGVRVEASYTVGEYDIVILSAEQSHGLATWLTQNGYHIPKGASSVLASYIAQGMRFFVAKVNLAEHARLGRTYLRPLQIAVETPKFMLPIRLGTVNASGPQDLIVYALSREGRVEPTNYRTVKLPTGHQLPTFLRDNQEFGRFYRAMFDTQVQRQNMRAVFVEHAWDMAGCDPCAADPLTPDELRRLGVFWIDVPSNPGATPSAAARAGRPGAGPQDVFVTRLHVRYDAAHFPEDLVFQQTGDKTNFQGRYVLRHPWTGTATCSAADAYRTQLATRHAKEAETLAALTGWTLSDIRQKMGLSATPAASTPSDTWWEWLWPPRD